MTPSLAKFKEQVMNLNKNSKEFNKDQNIKSEEVKKMERVKHEQNKKAVEKRVALGYPEFDVITVEKLLHGLYHDIPDDDEPEN